ncbi:MAG: helix-turn-helix domain-containing protein [Pseudomonadota bacterium]
MPRRSTCPIASLLDTVGDKWSLLIVRDLVFFGEKSFSDLQNAAERMATNILASRLERLERVGLITKRADPEDKRKKRYGLTESGRDLLPTLLEMMVWSSKHDPGVETDPHFIERIEHDRDKLIRDLQARIAR